MLFTTITTHYHINDNRTAPLQRCVNMWLPPTLTPGTMNLKSASQALYLGMFFFSNFTLLNVILLATCMEQQTTPTADSAHQHQAAMSHWPPTVHLPSHQYLNRPWCREGVKGMGMFLFFSFLYYRLWASSRNHNNNEWPAPLAPHTFNAIITDAANKASILTDTPSFLSSLTSQLLLISQLIRVRLPRFVYSFSSTPCTLGWKVLASIPTLSWATAWERLRQHVCSLLMWRKQPRRCQWAIRYVLFHSYLYLLLTKISF